MAKKLLKDKAWKLFSLYIKLRDADGGGLCECCTCGRKLEFDAKECHAGHFVAGRKNSVLFDEKVVFSQCDRCNLWGNGEQGKFVLFMKHKVGLSDDDIEELLNKKHETMKLSDDDVMKLMLGFYALINMQLSIKFDNGGWIVERVREKIKKWGLSKTLGIDKTLGVITH